MRKTVIALVVVLAVAGAGLLVKQRFFPEGRLILPYSSVSPARQLTDILGTGDINPTGQIIIKGSTMEASVSGVLVLFSSDKDLGLQVRTLQLILPRLKMEDKVAKEIDLRFNKVVIRY